jgi:hypothetical protein
MNDMKSFDVDKLKVARPCPASWNSMEGNERVRYCGLCELDVYNISEMTAAEVELLIANSSGRICGRLFKRADGTVLTQDCPVGINKYRKRLAKYYSAVLGAALALFSVSYGQTDKQKENDNGTFSVKVLRDGVGTSIKGVVTDENGALVPGAEITLKLGEKKAISTTTNGDGIYSFADREIAPGIYLLAVKSPGFRDFQEKHFSITGNQQIELDVVLKMAGATRTLGVLVSDAPLLTSTTNLIITTIEPRRIIKLPY